MIARRYRDTRRRLLVDMHIPDWDPAFLADYAPATLVDAARTAGAEGVMLYFQSHLGLCYYPTKVGVRHRAARDRDLAGEALDGFAAHGIPVTAYYSVNFNNRAWLDHPDWRLQPAAPATIGVLPRERYGIVCLNHPAYRAFVDAQIDEIAAYPVEAFFFDMMWWNGVCRCAACRDRYRAEADAALPGVIDWSSPVWTRFQSARERWLTEFAVAARDRVHRTRPDADVYHNFALGLSNWTRGVSFASVAGHDFLGGDFYGGRAEQLLMTRLMRNLTPHQPAEFMTTAATHLIEHTGLRTATALTTKAFAAASAGAAFLAIVAIDPRGTIDPEALARVRAAFDASRPYDGFTGGDAIEDIGIYCSDLSRMNFADDGRALAEAPAASAPDYPHYDALSGACRILQQTHLPFGVVTCANLHELARWRVLVLPDVQRMSNAEIAAFRAYVLGGGRLYASRGSSLAGRDDGQRDDFALADIFGCHFAGPEPGRMIYARGHPWPEPRRPLAHWRGAGGRVGALRLRAADGTTLVALTLPYGYPAGGTAADEDWASIHSSPPWRDETLPLVVRKASGAGAAIYSGFDIEAGGTPQHDALFVSLIRDLLPAPRFEVITHNAVWASGYDQPAQSRSTLCLLNYQLDEPILPVPSVRIRFRPPPGRHPARIGVAPDFRPLDWTVDDNGVVVIEAGPLAHFTIVVIDYA